MAREIAVVPTEPPVSSKHAPARVASPSDEPPVPTTGMPIDTAAASDALLMPAEGRASAETSTIASTRPLYTASASCSSHSSASSLTASRFALSRSSSFGGDASRDTSRCVCPPPFAVVGTRCRPPARARGTRVEPLAQLAAQPRLGCTSFLTCVPFSQSAAPSSCPLSVKSVAGVSEDGRLSGTSAHTYTQCERMHASPSSRPRSCAANALTSVCALPRCVLPPDEPTRATRSCLGHASAGSSSNLPLARRIFGTLVVVIKSSDPLPRLERAATPLPADRCRELRPPGSGSGSHADILAFHSAVRTASSRALSSLALDARRFEAHARTLSTTWAACSAGRPGSPLLLCPLARTSMPSSSASSASSEEEDLHFDCWLRPSRVSQS
mmetsp:Transcript_4833/g.10999  ORF Transcript_4833/g.10999 Transcript_4833/m.10999 type:complete len:385 (-) Transcript_4833:401-1555(-)